MLKQLFPGQEPPEVDDAEQYVGITGEQCHGGRPAECVRSRT